MAVDWTQYNACVKLFDAGETGRLLALLASLRGSGELEIPFANLEVRALRAAREPGRAKAASDKIIAEGRADYWTFHQAAVSAREDDDLPLSFQHSQSAHAAMQWAESKQNGYCLTHDYFSNHIPKWTEFFEKYITASPIAALEIGSWQGGSATWLLDKVVSKRGGRLTCIDTFEGSSEHAELMAKLGDSLEVLFDNNIRRTGHGELVRKLTGYSQEVLPTLDGETFDFIYIDGAHEAKFVIQDLILSWRLIKSGGCLLLDDIPFTFHGEPEQNTRVATDFFTSVFRKDIEVLDDGYQLLIRRK